MANGFVHTVYKNDEWTNELEGEHPSAEGTPTRKTPSQLDVLAPNKTTPNILSTTKTAQSANATPTATTPPTIPASTHPRPAPHTFAGYRCWRMAA